MRDVLGLGWLFAEIELHKIALLDINGIYLICMESETAKVFWSGRSQAVRLPKKFRFVGNKVHIRRHGDKVILEPLALDWSWLDEIREKLDADCLAAASEKLPMQERKSLEALFE